MKLSPALFLAIPLMACAGGEDQPHGRTPPVTTIKILSDHSSEFIPAIEVQPKAATLATGATQNFTAQINYEPNGPRYMRQPVSWAVVENDGGAITHAGVYTAPDKPGIYHVKAEREDHRGVQDTATVTVKAPQKP